MIFRGSVVVQLILVAALAAQVAPPSMAADAPAGQAGTDGNSYFPLTAGTIWKYLVSSEMNDKAEKPYVQTLTAGAGVTSEGKTLLPLGDEVYLVKEDGVYLYGHREGDGKVQALDEPRKIVSAKPHTSEAWSASGKGESTYSTCLGSQSIKTEAGDFTTQCVFSSTAIGADAATTRSISRYFARGVGLVRETVSEKIKKPDGTLSIRETTRDLIAFIPIRAGATTAPSPAARSTTGPSGGNGVAVEKLLVEGRKLAAEGNARGALGKFAEAVAADPKLAMPHAYKAMAHAALGQGGEAINESDLAVRIDGSDSAVWEAAGRVRIALNQVDRGRAMFDKAAQLAPTRAGTIYMDLAAALAARNEPKLAGDVEAALKLAAAADPPSADALFQLGQSYANAGKAEGKAYLQRYVAAADKLPASERDAQKIQVAKQMIRALDILDSAKGR